MALPGAFSYKLKVKPNDFIVIEKCDIKFAQPSKSARTPKFKIYELTKTNWNTVDLLRILSKHSGIPFSKFSYAGKKDRHAVTKQFISVEHEKNIEEKNDQFEVAFRGYSHEPVSARSIEGNEFRLVLRSVSKDDIDTFRKNVDEIKQTGIPNYFDDQRFGSNDRDLGLPGKYLIQQDWSGALKSFLTGIYPEDKRHAKDRKASIRQVWGDWAKISTMAQTQIEKKIFAFLENNPKDVRGALGLLPKEEVSMAFSAIQSFFWNELAGRVVQSNAKNSAIVKGKLNDFHFPLEWEGQALLNLADLNIPVPGPGYLYSKPILKKAYTKVSEGVPYAEGFFREIKIGKAYLKGFDREMIMFPLDLRIVDIQSDELYQGRQKIEVTFSLPKGSYATIVIKRLTLLPIVVS